MAKRGPFASCISGVGVIVDGSINLYYVFNLFCITDGSNILYLANTVDCEAT
jgi:hypothetical protein